MRRDRPGGPCVCMVVGALLFVAAAGSGCGEAPADQHSQATSAATAEAPRYARGFTVRPHDGYRIVEVTRPWRAAETVFRYALVPRGRPVPQDLGDAAVIRTPVRSIVALSTTHIGFLDALGLADRIVGVSGAPWVHSPAVRAQLADGATVDVGPSGAVDVERIVELDPDLVMLSGAEEATALVGQLERLGVPVVINAEYVESTPLGRAEWVRFTASFFGLDDRADTLFTGVAERYEQLAAAARAAAAGPTVLTQAGWRGAWFVPGGESFAARLIADAGGRYLWADTDAEVSIQLDFESVYARAADADVWLSPGAATSLEALADMDERYTRFSAWQRGAVYNHDRRLTPAGGNDYWESAVARPDVVLADLVKIFHPALVPDHAFVYYRRLPRTEAASG